MPFINPQSTLGRSSRSDWLIMGALPVVFILMALVSTPENALAVSASVGVFATVIQAKWNSRRDPRMWVLIGTVAAVQVPVLYLIHIPRLSFGLVCLPFGLIEGFALWGLLNWIERRLPHSGNPTASAGS